MTNQKILTKVAIRLRVIVSAVLGRPVIYRCRFEPHDGLSVGVGPNHRVDALAYESEFMGPLNVKITATGAHNGR